MAFRAEWVLVAATLLPACSCHEGQTPPPAAPAPAYYTYAPMYVTPAAPQPVASDPIPPAPRRHRLPKPSEPGAATPAPVVVVAPQPVVVQPPMTTPATPVVVQPPMTTPATPVVARPPVMTTPATPVVVQRPPMTASATPVVVTPVASRPVARPSVPPAQPTLHPVPVARTPRPHPSEPSIGTSPELGNVQRTAPIPAPTSASVPRVINARRVSTRPMNPAQAHIAPVALQPVAVHRVVLRPSPIQQRKAENF